MDTDEEGAREGDGVLESERRERWDGDPTSRPRAATVAGGAMVAAAAAVSGT